MHPSRIRAGRILFREIILHECLGFMLLNEISPAACVHSAQVGWVAIGVDSGLKTDAKVDAVALEENWRGVRSHFVGSTVVWIAPW